MPTRNKADAGREVLLYNGLSARRWYCLTPGCMGSIATLDHDKGRLHCMRCTRGLAQPAPDTDELAAPEDWIETGTRETPSRDPAGWA